LGLSISKKIVEEKFGGQILLLPYEQGQGATFEIHLRKAS
jgi:signal transduction histidine kinase